MKDLLRDLLIFGITSPKIRWRTLIPTLSLGGIIVAINDKVRIIAIDL